MTARLNEHVSAFLDAFLDARDELDDRQYGVYVELLTEIVGREATRLIIGAALRARRDSAVAA